MASKKDSDWTQLKASDEDREKVIAELRQHYSLGRLTIEELQDRLTKCLEVKTVSELYTLTNDLPYLGIGNPASPMSSTRRKKRRRSWL
ncbi:MAG: DUF1707 domain-containing protein [Actinobacteria bacterium]|jgi:hypothetical protein|nr:DUF1707 domain-containing protein [Actinomycetota bacterium]MCL6104251.1 DUF1707 domain-containing protein [Actinomycetota bacterium]